MDRPRLKQVLVGGIDKILNVRPWLSGITPEQRAVLMAARQAAINSDAVLDAILVYVGPYEQQARAEHEEMMLQAPDDPPEERP